MSSYGLGSVYRRADGRWVAAIAPDGKKQVRYGKSEREARRMLTLLWQEYGAEQAMKAIAEANAHGACVLPTVAEFIPTWLASAAIKAATREGYEDTLKAYVVPYVGTMRLDEITPPHVAQMVAAILAKGVSGQTAAHAYKVLRRLLQVATDWEMLDRNAAAKVRRPRIENGQRQMWTPEQAQMFLTTMQRHVGLWDDLFIVALLTGLRRPEALGLQWGDIDLAAGTMRVERGVVELRGNVFKVETLKTRASRRLLSLPRDAVAALHHRHARSAAQGARDFVFRNERGLPPTRQALADVLERACKRAGVPRMTIHGLRHMHISLLAHAGVPVKAAQERAGHSTPFMTLSVYTHTLGDGDKRAAAALDTLFAEGGATMKAE